MSSPPPTPLEFGPNGGYEKRLRETGYPCEWAEKYRPGGFHPVNLGDTFNKDQYKVIRKLGYGSFSIVWLARDTINAKYVALKIMRAKSSVQNATELSILELISQSKGQDTQAIHVNATTLLDKFYHDGPNGTHLCLVFEPMGSSVETLREELPEKLPRRPHHTNQYPNQIAKLILKHTLHGLSFLHRNGIVHSDLQPGNLLFAMSDINSLSEQELEQDRSGHNQTSRPERIQRLDGKKDKWAPEFLYLGQTLHKYVLQPPDMQIKISDFGVAFWEKDPPRNPVTPTSLRAPEIIFGDKVDSKIDIWSFGCLVYEVLTSYRLFFIDELGTSDEQIDDDNLLEFNDTLRPLPEHWLKEKWPRASRYFGPNRERIAPKDRKPLETWIETSNESHIKGNVDTGVKEDVAKEVHKDLPGVEDDELWREEYKKYEWVGQPLEVQFKENKPEDIDDAEEKVIISLIRSILKYDPNERPTVEEILEHPWFIDA